MKEPRLSMQQYLRCVILYHELGHVRTLHYAVRVDSVDNFTKMIQDTFVHPDINFTDIIYTYDNMEFFNLI